MSAEKERPLTLARRIAKRFIKDERGDFGIGQIAAIVAGIVIIGVVITVVTDSMDTWIGTVWGWIESLFQSAGLATPP